MKPATIALASISVITLAVILGIFFGGLEDNAPAWGFAGVGLGYIGSVAQRLEALEEQAGEEWLVEIIHECRASILGVIIPLLALSGDVA